MRVRLPVALIILSTLARLVSLAGLHPLNYDEIEFFRATDWMARGLVPYRDFWEHHSPLQWFVFAPIAALIDVPGAKAILLRWAQVPLWIAIFWLIDVWMRDAGLPRHARWAALVLPLTSSLFMLPAVEYRVDLLAGGLFLLGLVCVQRISRGVGYAWLAGAAFCLAGFANLRLGPVLVLAMLLARIVDPENRRWRGGVRANWIFAGAAAAFIVCASYFVVTGSAHAAFRRLWTDNLLADRLASEVLPHMFLRRVLTPFGLGIRGAGSSFVASSVDPAGILLTLGFLFAAGRCLWLRRRQPDHLFYLAFVAAANILFIATMKFVYNYHFETAAVLAVPLLALEVGRIRGQRWIAGLLVLLTLFNVSVALFRGKEADTAYQDTIMREVDRRTTASMSVLDGSGWALRRRPAYRLWCLRYIALLLIEHGDYPRYGAADLLRDPPGAVVVDYDLRVWFARDVALGRMVTAHYLPTLMAVWLPAPNARLTPAAPSARWRVAQNGLYKVYASPRLAAHPWFRQPLFHEAAYWRDRSLVALRPSDLAAATVDFAVNGRSVSGGTLALRRGDVITASSRVPVPVGVMLVPGAAEERFVFPESRGGARGILRASMASSRPEGGDATV